jgi:hypothetical protein
MGVGEGGLDKTLRVVDLLFTPGGNEKISLKLAELGITAEVIEGQVGSAFLVEEIADRAFQMVNEVVGDVVLIYFIFKEGTRGLEDRSMVIEDGQDLKIAVLILI